MKTRIPVVSVRGELKDVRGYNLTADDIGQYAVICWGYNSLSVAATYDAAISQAAALTGPEYDEDGNPIDFADGVKPWPDFDGDTTCDEIREGWIDEDGNITEDAQ
jgi:hypothetical protein